MKRIMYGAVLGLAFFAVHPAISSENKVIQSAANQAVSIPNVESENSLRLSTNDRETIEFVVEMHVASLNQQRADLFTKTLATKTQEAFDTPDEVLLFFSLRYVPVVFAKTFDFDSLSVSGSVPVQHGYLVDKKGTRWRMSFGLMHHGGGDWRIISTVIEPAPGDPT